MVAWSAMVGYGIATPVDVGVVWKRMTFLYAMSIEHDQCRVTGSL